MQTSLSTEKKKKKKKKKKLIGGGVVGGRVGRGERGIYGEWA